MREVIRRGSEAEGMSLPQGMAALKRKSVREVLVGRKLAESDISIYRMKLMFKQSVSTALDLIAGGSQHGE